MQNIDVVLEYCNYQSFDRFFRDYGFLKYVLRSIEKHIPWYRKIFLIVEDKSQIPEWLKKDNDKLRIVYHDEFIPKKYLYTRNSCTIECFLHRIEDLSDCYLIVNDDTFFVKDMQPDDFFDFSEDCVRLKFGYEFIDDGFNDLLFDRMVDHMISCVCDVCKKDFKKINIEHGILPHYKPYQEKLFSLLNLSDNDITRYRAENSMGSQYMYLYYYIFSEKCINVKERTLYISVDEIVKTPDFNDNKMICINDNRKLKEINLFCIICVEKNVFLEKLFPDYSSFEVVSEKKDVVFWHAVSTKPYVNSGDSVKMFGDIVCAALSVKLLKKKGYSVCLYTDSLGCYLLYDMGYDRVVVDDEYNYDDKAFSSKKYECIKHIDEKSIIIDTDIFIFDDFYLDVDGADLIFDRLECIENGDDQSNKYRSYIQTFLKDNPNCKPDDRRIQYDGKIYCCGAIGGKISLLNELREYYVKNTNEFKPGSVYDDEKLKKTYAFIVEQLFITNFWRYNVKFLNPSGNRVIGASKGYVHAIGLFKYEYFDYIVNALDLISEGTFSSLEDKAVSISEKI